MATNVDSTPLKLTHDFEKSRRDREERMQHKLRNRGGLFQATPQRDNLFQVLLGKKTISPVKRFSHPDAPQAYYTPIPTLHHSSVDLPYFNDICRKPCLQNCRNHQSPLRTKPNSTAPITAQIPPKSASSAHTKRARKAQSLAEIVQPSNKRNPSTQSSDTFIQTQATAEKGRKRKKASSQTQEIESDADSPAPAKKAAPSRKKSSKQPAKHPNTLDEEPKASTSKDRGRSSKRITNDTNGTEPSRKRVSRHDSSPEKIPSKRRKLSFSPSPTRPRAQRNDDHLEGKLPPLRSKRAISKAVVGKIGSPASYASGPREASPTATTRSIRKLKPQPKEPLVIFPKTSEELPRPVLTLDIRTTPPATPQRRKVTFTPFSTSRVPPTVLRRMTSATENRIVDDDPDELDLLS
ncbi:hypothetical protein DL96DRAFT_1594232 [Flagelloscypha sp. PMI_526]|nr:hypothetical protein DL96DRAFT_1594232 [Flagelloscypha sp. PMI_526]